MNLEEITTALDAEIGRLQQVRDAIAGYSGNVKRRGRPPGSGVSQPTKRTFSAAVRKKMAAGQRKRWANQKNVVVTKVPPREAPVKRMRKQVSAKLKTALSADVPTKPIAVPASKK